MTRSVTTVVVLLSVLVASLARGADQPDVYLLVVDALRADHVGAYGYERPTTPNLNAWTRGAVVYTRAHSTAPWTPSSVASILSGEYPTAHGLRTVRGDLSAGVGTIRPGVAMLAETLAARGYATAAVVANDWLQPRLGYGRGFGQYVTLRNRATAAEVNARVLHALWSTPRPRFVYVHYMDVHGPYSAGYHDRAPVELGPVPARYQRTIPHPETIHNATGWNGEPSLARIVDAYDQGVRAWDNALPMLLSYLDGVVIVTADHGEELFDHGKWTHGHTLYEELLHVPLAIAAVGLKPGRCDGLVSLVDLAPTVLACAGVSSERDLRRCPDNPVYAEIEADAGGGALTPTRSRYAAIVGTQKAVWRPRDFVLFDLGADPGEQSPLRADDAPIWAMLHSWRESVTIRAALLGASGATTLTAAERARLEALGYGE